MRRFATERRAAPACSTQARARAATALSSTRSATWGVDLAVGDARLGLRRYRLPSRPRSVAVSRRRVRARPCRSSCSNTPSAPAAVLSEIARTLEPGGLLLLVAPQQWEVHQAPHDYFRFTRYGLEHLLREAGFEEIEVEALGGHFSLLARRLIGCLSFCQGGWRWAAFPVVACLVGPLALLLPSLDRLDSNKETTPGVSMSRSQALIVLALAVCMTAGAGEPPRKFVEGGEQALKFVQRAVSLGPRPSGSEAQRQQQQWIPLRAAHARLPRRGVRLPGAHSARDTGDEEHRGQVRRGRARRRRFRPLRHLSTPRMSFVGANDGGSSTGFPARLRTLAFPRKTAQPSLAHLL